MSLPLDNNTPTFNNHTLPRSESASDFFKLAMDEALLKENPTFLLKIKAPHPTPISFSVGQKKQMAGCSLLLSLHVH